MYNLKIEAAREQSYIPLKPYHQWMAEAESVRCSFYRLNDDFVLRFPDLADFKIDSDTLIVQCWPLPNIALETVKQIYFNQVAPLVQSHQSKLVFHGGAVVVENHAIAFVGASGLGKSTITASFSSHGYPFLTDDGLLIQSIDEKYYVAPSYPSIRLWEDSQLAILGVNAKSKGPLDYTPKLRFAANERMVHCTDLTKLYRVYFLGNHNTALAQTKFTKLSARSALVELIKHSFLLDVDDKKVLAEHFVKLSKLSTQDIFFQLDYPREYAELPNVRASILQHAGLGERIGSSI